ncbi:MAG TPA: dihydroorotase, partial [Stenomitos sp.]
MTDELLKQVRVLNPVTQRDEIADVWVADGKIQAIAPEVTGYPDGTRVRDCNGCVLGPGLVDLYSTVDEPGFESRETVASL